MKKKVAVVANPKAGKNTPRAGLGKTIASILTTPRRTYSPDTLAALEATARQLNGDRPDILAIAGGDGTIHQTLTRLLREHEKSPDVPLPQVHSGWNHEQSCHGDWPDKTSRGNVG